MIEEPCYKVNININIHDLTAKMQHSVELKGTLWTKHILFSDTRQTAHHLRKQDLIMEMFN